MGVTLVVVGTLFLVVQLVPGFEVPWWSLWPLVIVVAGVVQAFTPGRRGWGVSRVTEGVGTALFGLVLLGNTTGYVSWRVWWVFITLWPALVIALGLAILSKGIGQNWLRLLATLVVWATLVYAALASWSGVSSVPTSGVWVPSGGQEFSFSEPGAGVTDASLALAGGAGDIVIGSESGGELVSIKGASPFGPPAFSVSKNGRDAAVKVGLNQSGRETIWTPGMAGARIDARLSDSVLWDVSLETGASSLDADLSGVRVHDAEVKAGVSAVTVKVGAVPAGEHQSTLTVKSGVSSVTILLPRGAEARLETQNGLVASDVGGRFERRGGTWQTPGFDSASKTWDIRTEAGVGSVSVDTY